MNMIKTYKAKRTETHLIDVNPLDEQDKTVVCERCGREFIYEEDELYCRYCGAKIKK